MKGKKIFAFYDMLLKILIKISVTTITTTVIMIVIMISFLQFSFVRPNLPVRVPHAVFNDLQDFSFIL